MDAQRPSLPLRQHGEVSAGLRRSYHSEGVLLPWHRNVLRIVTRDLQKDAAVRSTFIGLAGGMEEARAEAKAGCVFSSIAGAVANSLERLLMRRIHFDVREQSKIIAGGEPANVSAKNGFEGRACVPQRAPVRVIGEEGNSS